jgi:hypothetical protein
VTLHAKATKLTALHGPDSPPVIYLKGSMSLPGRHSGLLPPPRPLPRLLRPPPGLRASLPLLCVRLPAGLLSQPHAGHALQLQAAHVAAVVGPPLLQPSLVSEAAAGGARHEAVHSGWLPAGALAEAADELRRGEGSGGEARR